MEGKWERLKFGFDYEINTEYPYTIRKVKNSDKILKTPFYPKTRKNKSGITIINLYGRTFTLSHIIAEQWLPDMPEIFHDYPGMEQVGYKNGDKTDLHIENLEWIINSSYNI